MTKKFPDNINKIVAISLSNSPASDSGICIVDKSKEIIFIDKLNTDSSIKNFLENVSAKLNTLFLISFPIDFLLLNSRWKVNAKATVLFDPENSQKPNKNLINKYSVRLNEFFAYFQKEHKATIIRFDIYKLRMQLNLLFTSKTHSSKDCRMLQSAIESTMCFKNMPSNLLPICVLEALTGAHYGSLLINNIKLQNLI